MHTRSSPVQEKPSAEEHHTTDQQPPQTRGCSLHPNTQRSSIPYPRLLPPSQHTKKLHPIPEAAPSIPTHQAASSYTPDAKQHLHTYNPAVRIISAGKSRMEVPKVGGPPVARLVLVSNRPGPGTPLLRTRIRSDLGKEGAWG